MHDGDSAVPHRRSEAGDVGHHPAADGDDDVVAGQARRGECSRHVFDGHQRLALLPRADVDAHELAIRHEGADGAGERDRRLGHHGDALRPQWEQLGKTDDGTGADVDVVAALAESHRDGAEVTHQRAI